MNTLFIVRSNAALGREAEYNHWYTDVHLEEVLAIEGFKTAQRFKLSSAQAQPAQAHSFLAIYEIDSADRATVAITEKAKVLST